MKLALNNDETFPRKTTLKSFVVSQVETTMHPPCRAGALLDANISTSWWCRTWAR